MNKAKWVAERSMPKLVIKLAEETGEVAKAHLNVGETSMENDREDAIIKLLEEAQHARFIAQCIVDLITEGDALNGA